MSDLENTLKEISVQLKKLEKLDSLEEKVSSIEKCLRTELEQLKMQVEGIKEDRELEKKKEQERKRLKNIIIFGMERSSPGAVLDKFMDMCKCMEIELRRYDIQYVHFINPQKKDGPIKIRFLTMAIRNDVLKRKKLLMSNNLYKEVKIKEDLPEDIRRTRRDLFVHLMNFKKQGKRATMKRDMLLVEGKLFTLKDLQEMDNRNKRMRSEEKSPESKEKQDTSEIKTPGKKQPKINKTNRNRSNSIERYCHKQKPEEKTASIVEAIPGNSKQSSS